MAAPLTLCHVPPGFESQLARLDAERARAAGLLEEYGYPPPVSETAAELIDALLAEGEAVESGSFTLDVEAASAKLEAFQYADRKAYLVPIFEALVGFGAREINLRTKGLDLMISAEGISLDEPLAGLAKLHLRQLADHEGMRERLLARLSVGLDMALGLHDLDRVVFSYSDLEHMYVAEHRGEGSPRLARSSAQVTGELQILIDYAGLNLLGDRHDVLERLYPAVNFTEVEIRADGELISQQPRDETSIERGEGPGFRYEAWLVALEPAQIELWSHGVRVGSLPSPHDNLAGVLHLERPRRDLSQLEIVRDQVVEAGLEALVQARETLLEAREQREQEHIREWIEADEQDQRDRERRAEQAEQAKRQRELERIERAGAFSAQQKLQIFAVFGLSTVVAAAGVLLIQRARGAGIVLVLVAVALNLTSVKKVAAVLARDEDRLQLIVGVAVVLAALQCALYNYTWPPFS